MTMKKLLAGHARSSQQSTGARPVWPLNVVAASILALSAYGTDANALALGRITVLSALGEPLRAEIEVPQISAEEASSFSAVVASPDAFKSAGLEYNTAVGTLKVSLQQQGEGQARLQLQGDKTINDPFVDLVLEARWSSGRIVRSYTMLLNPPSARQAQPAAPLQSAQIQAQPAMPAPSSTAPAVSAPARSSSRVASPVAEKPAPRARAESPARPAASVEGEKITVRPGDTAGKIAAARKDAHVSLDQMLLALLQSNPDAFIDGNVNRIRSGAVLEMPSAAQALAVPPEDAHKNIVAQSRNFNDFRRKLAENAPTGQVEGANRQAAGKLEARVEDKKVAAPAPDKLTLSKGSTQGKSSATQIAQARQSQDTAQRAAELSKNIEDLAKLGAASSGTEAAAAVAAKGTASSPAITLTAPAAVAASAPSTAASAAVASAPVSASPPAAAASANGAAAVEPVATPPIPATKPAPKPIPVVAETSLLDDLIENPLVPLGAAALVALLAGFGIYRAKRRREAPVLVDSAFIEENQPLDSFFGTSGGQQVDTSDTSQSGSSMMYSPSQLDTGGDVDPVAEADVYLAYGRDLQAEEILKEALRTQPSRMAVRTKLHEIYFKRRDVRSFSSFAEESSQLCGGQGPEWEQICAMGKEIDPANTLYEFKRGNDVQAQAVASSQPDESTRPAPLGGGAGGDSAQSLSVDVDLDIDLGAPYTQPPSVVPETAQAPTISPPAAAPVSPAEPAAARSSNMDVDLDFAIDFAMDEAPAQAPSASPNAAAPASDPHMLEFDLGSLSLELDAPSEPPRQPDNVPVAAMETETSGEQEQQSTKLALAQEFLALGDADGARALAQEVVAEASGPLKSKAQRFLADLS